MAQITGRIIAWEISQGLRPEQFIGNKTKEMLQQELFSLNNRYTPETMTTFEKVEFEKDLVKIIAGIMRLPKEHQTDLYRTVTQMLNP